MEFRHNEVLGFGKFLGGVQRLIFFFFKEKFLWSCLLCQVSSAKDTPVKEGQVGLGPGRFMWKKIYLCTHLIQYTCLNLHPPSDLSPKVNMRESLDLIKWLESRIKDCGTRLWLFLLCEETLRGAGIWPSGCALGRDSKRSSTSLPKKALCR
jgi:hypothetical protein